MLLRHAVLTRVIAQDAHWPDSREVTPCSNFVAGAMATNIHDEEVLGVEAYAAELELLVNGANQGGTRLDPRAALDLQKLLLSLNQSPPELVKQHQRHVEDCLASLLLAGAPPSVRAPPHD